MVWLSSVKGLLQEKKLVKCLNPKDIIYKIYQLTALGKDVLRNIENSQIRQ